MKTLALTVGVLVALFAFVGVIFALVRLFAWLSGGELWGLALLLTLVSLPFAYLVARTLRT